MAGGYGTRLQPLTLRTPKCILPIGNTTPIERIISGLTRAGVNEIIVSLNKNQIKVKEFLESKSLDAKVDYIFEESSENKDKLGAIGALQYVIDHFGSDDYFVLGADNYTVGLNYSDMLELHRKKGADVTLALFELPDITKVSMFGIGIVDADSRIVSFQEKPKVEEAKSKLASTFVYIINKSFFDSDLSTYVENERKAGRKPDNIGDLWEYFVDKRKIYGYIFSGYWGDVGSPLFYVEINHKALDEIKSSIGNISMGIGSKISGEVVMGNGCKVGDNVTIIGPCFIGDGVEIGSGSIIGPYTSILHNSKIGKNNMIGGSILFDGVVTHNNVKITRALIDGNVEIYEDNRIEEKAMVGYSCRIGPNSQILYDTKLWPFLEVDKESVINGKVFYPKGYVVFEDKIKRSRYWE